MLPLFNINRDILKQLILLSAPIVVSQGAYAVMIFTDRLFMSFISPTHMAASLGGGVAAFFCLSFFVGTLSYGNALSAQFLGARQFTKCSKVLSQSVVLVLVSVPLLLLLTLLLKPMFELMGHEPEQAALEREYFAVLMFGAGISLLKVAFSSFFSGIGRTRTVMIADLSGIAANIPLSYLLVFGKAGFPELGILGAALGTLASTLITVVIFVYAYWRPKIRVRFRVAQSFVFDREIIAHYLSKGFPSGLEMFLNVAAFNLFLLMFQAYGVAQGAAVAIVFNWDMLSFVPMIGLHVGIISLIGRYMGANQLTKIDQLIKAGFFIAWSYSAVLALLYLIFREPLVDLFLVQAVAQEETRKLALSMMLGLACYTMVDASILVASGVLRGAGDTRWLMKASVLLHWLMLVAQYFVIKVWQLEPIVSWAVFVAMIIAIALTYGGRLRTERWRGREALGLQLREPA